MKLSYGIMVTLCAAACSRGVHERTTSGSVSSGSASVGFTGVAAALDRGDAPKTTSVLVMQRGAIVHEAYFNGATTDTLHDTRSATKTLTALTVGIAIDRGALPGVDAKAFDYFSELEPTHDNPAKAAITIRDLLAMASALDCDDDLDASPGNEVNMYPKQSWLRWALAIPTRAPFQRAASGYGPFHYCTAGSFLLGQIVQRAARTPVDEFMAAQLLRPLGIAHWEFVRSPSNEVMTGGQLRLRSRDLATVAEMMRTGGAWHGTQIVPAAWLRAMMTLIHPDAIPQLTMGQGYGLQIWHRNYKSTCGHTIEGWLMSGNGGNHIVIAPELDAVIVVTRTNYNTRGMHPQTTQLIEDHILPGLGCGTGAPVRPG